ncbi:hypothetical protein CO661_14275 [Sinorhizobium fredii]|uniref:Uncharacterized protein n=1 Tax=Rhizobium fredii TaxID=380 RepID=A0A2A6LY77_RHIFR|nr:hypothetical protein [Sinorhizobium fredii]PDT47345.1 hypothetical protein CO661_14275 [Sinorhizobium fredii]
MLGLVAAIWQGRQYAIGAAAGFLIFSAVNALWWLPAARSEGRALERAASIARSIEIIQQRSRTNAEINALTPGALCSELGGVFENGECH